MEEKHIWLRLSKLALFTLLCSVCIYSFANNVKDLGFLLLLLLIYLILEDWLKVKA